MHTRIVRRAEAPVELLPQVAGNAVVGIDLSLRGTGVALLLDGRLRRFWGWTEKKGLQKKNAGLLCWYKMPANTESHRQHRAQLLTEWVIGIVMQAYSLAQRVHVGIEGYAFSQNNRGTSDIHEAAGTIKAWLWAHSFPFRIYDPLSVKLAWTGSGAAKKPEMIKAASKLFRVNLEPFEDAAENLADAMLIAALLHEELEYKAGRRSLEKADPNIRRVMLRATKTEPEALITRDFISAGSIEPPDPVLGSTAA